jgi:hypothetical protein
MLRTGSAIFPLSLRGAKGDEAIWAGDDEIAAHLSGARNDNLKQISQLQK